MGIRDKGIYDKIKRNNPYFEDFITRSVYHSNAIEGNTLSYAETYAIIFNDNSMKVQAKPRELYEAINLKYVMDFMLKTLDEELSLDYIKKIGVLVNRNINEISGFRTAPVFILGAEHIPPEASYVPQLLSEMLYRDRTESFANNIYERVAAMHISFERIHPFSDGNGRTGRALITKELLREGYAPVVVTVDNKAEYIDLLAKQAVSSLASFICKLSEKEEERMKQFGISIHNEEGLAPSNIRGVHHQKK